MSTIPLPALAARPPEPQDPLASIKNILALRGLQNQQQIQQQQITAGSQENQQRAIALQAQQTIASEAANHVIRDKDGTPTGYDYDGLTAAATAKGVPPQFLAPLQAMHKNAVDTVLAQTQADKNNIDNQQNLNKQGYEKLEAFKAITDPAERQANWVQNVQWAKQNKIDTSQWPIQAPDNTKIPTLEAALGMHAQALEDAKTQAATAKDTAEAQRTQTELEYYKGTGGVLAPGVTPDQAGLMTYMRTVPGATPDKYPAYKAQKEAEATEPVKLHLAVAEKAAEQAIADGDPKAAAKLLIDGTVAPSQIISSRKPAFAQQAFSAASQMQPGWNAQKADADYKVASSPQQVAFFGSAKSLTDKGGTLDQLADAAKDIPANQIPVFNTVADAVRASTGSGPVAKYASLALGVADDYSKVMGGGQGSDTSRSQALNLIAAKQSPEQRAAAIEGIRGAVGSQANSRIGNNAVLKKMYGSELPRTGEHVPGGKANGLTDGQTGTGSDGIKYVVKGGVWVKQ